MTARIWRTVGVERRNPDYLGVRRYSTPACPILGKTVVDLPSGGL
jgi:hypothetical protein